MAAPEFVPGVSRLAYGTDQGRFLQETLRQTSSNNPYRAFTGAPQRQANPTAGVGVQSSPAAYQSATHAQQNYPAQAACPPQYTSCPMQQQQQFSSQPAAMASTGTGHCAAQSCQPNTPYNSQRALTPQGVPAEGVQSIINHMAAASISAPKAIGGSATSTPHRPGTFNPAGIGVATPQCKLSSKPPASPMAQPTAPQSSPVPSVEHKPTASPYAQQLPVQAPMQTRTPHCPPASPAFAAHVTPQQALTGRGTPQCASAPCATQPRTQPCRPAQAASSGGWHPLRQDYASGHAAGGPAAPSAVAPPSALSAPHPAVNVAPAVLNAYSANTYSANVDNANAYNASAYNAHACHASACNTNSYNAPWAMPIAPRPTPPAAPAAPLPQAGFDPGDPRTLAYGTDKGRWLQEICRTRAGADGGSSNPYRMHR